MSNHLNAVGFWGELPDPLPHSLACWASFNIDPEFPFQKFLPPTKIFGCTSGKWTPVVGASSNRHVPNAELQSSAINILNFDLSH